MIELDGVASVADVARVQALRRGSAPALRVRRPNDDLRRGRRDGLAHRQRADRIRRPDAGADRLSRQEHRSFPALPARRLQGARDARAVQLPPRRPGDRPPARGQRRQDSSSSARMSPTSPTRRSPRLASKPRMIALGFDREGYERLEAWIEAARRERPPARGGPGGRRDPALHVGHDRRFPKGCG